MRERVDTGLREGLGVYGLLWFGFFSKYEKHKDI